MLEDEDGEDVDEADEDEPEDSDSDSDSDSDADSEDPEEAAELAEPVSLASESAAELPGAVTHDTAVLPSMVVTSLASPAALESMVEMDAGIIHVLAPTTEHNEVAKNVALATSSLYSFGQCIGPPTQTIVASHRNSRYPSMDMGYCWWRTSNRTSYTLGLSHKSGRQNH